MALLPLRLPPGVYRNGTRYQSKNRWFDANCVRCFEGTVRPLGGWQELTATGQTVVASVFRDTFTGTVGGLLDAHTADLPSSGATWTPSAGSANTLVLDGAGNVVPNGINTGNITRYYNDTDLGVWLFGEEAFFETGPLPASGFNYNGLIFMADGAAEDFYEMRITLHNVGGSAWEVGTVYMWDFTAGIKDTSRSIDIPAGSLTNITGLVTGTSYRFGVTLVSGTQVDFWREAAGGGNRLALGSWIGNSLPLSSARVDSTHTQVGLSMRLVDPTDFRTVDLLEVSRSQAGSAEITVVGTPRTMLGWRGNDNNQVLAIGTNETLNIHKQGVLYDITPAGFVPGSVDTAFTATGGLPGSGNYSFGVYGDGLYGVADPAQQTFENAAIWHLDNFGDFLVGVCSPNDGRLYYWDNDTATDAVRASGAPTSNTGVVVTPERFVVLLGAGGLARHLAWASQETLDTWTPDRFNTAGDFDLEGVGTIVCGRRSKGETLIWTTDDVHAMRYIGGTLVYSFEKIGSKCGIVAPNAVALVDTKAIWMGLNQFFVYDGYVKSLPCEVSDFVFSDFNLDQRVKVHCVTRSQFGEVTWYYPSQGSTENDRYVTWSYREGHWMTGMISRTAGVDAGALQYPVLATAAGKMYEHEKSFAHGGTPSRGGTTVDTSDPAVLPFIESGPVELGDGDQVMYVSQLLPDEKTLGDAQFYLRTRYYPEDTPILNGPFVINKLTDVRFSGRQCEVRVEEVNAVDWRIGNIRLDAMPAGGR